MKIKVVVIDLELSRRAKRIAAAVAIPLVLLGGAAVGYAEVPRTWKDGETLKAEDLNASFKALDAVIEARLPGTTWKPYTPQIAGAAPLVTTTSGAWRRVGDSVEVRVETKVPSCNVGGQLRWTLPDGLVANAAKLPGAVATLGTAAVYLPGKATLQSVAVSSYGANPYVVIEAPGVPGGLYCSHLEDGAVIRASFSVPVE
jgi:hypothetical protein